MLSRENVKLGVELGVGVAAGTGVAGALAGLGLGTEHLSYSQLLLIIQ